MAERLQDLIASLRGSLAGRDDVRLALLFGSRATGRARSDSDVDVAVLAPGVDLYGIVVHEASAGEAAAWRARALMQLETDRPAFDRMREAFLRRLARGE